MHKEAYEWLVDNRPAGPQVVLDLGSREAGSGRVRSLFTDSLYVGLDAQNGPGVDHVADICDRSTWPVMDPFTVVVCAEVIEHECSWDDVIENAALALDLGGTLLLTAAGVGRPPHTCLPLAYTPDGPPDQDGGYPPNPGEWYANIEWGDLEETARSYFSIVKVETNDDHHDIYCKASK